MTSKSYFCNKCKKKHYSSGHVYYTHLKSSNSPRMKLMTSSRWRTRKEAQKYIDRYENKSEIRDIIINGKKWYRVFGIGKPKLKPKISKTLTQMTRKEYLAFADEKGWFYDI